MIGQNILVAEDEVKIAGILQDYLTKAGYRVVCLDRGDLVVPYVRQQQPISDFTGPHAPWHGWYGDLPGDKEIFGGSHYYDYGPG